MSLRLPALLLACASAAVAGPSNPRTPVRMWVDKDGVVHVDDTQAGPTSSNAGRWKRQPRATGRSEAPPAEVKRAAQAYNIPEELVRAIIDVESDGQADAVSHKGAVGLMQLMPGTAKDMYVRDIVEPGQNIHGGTRYLRVLANEFAGDMMLTVAAYNAGPEAVRKYGGVPPFAETREYVKKVMARYYQYKNERAKAAQP